MIYLLCGTLNIYIFSLFFPADATSPMVASSFPTSQSKCALWLIIYLFFFVHLQHVDNYVLITSLIPSLIHGRLIAWLKPIFILTQSSLVVTYICVSISIIMF